MDPSVLQVPDPGSATTQALLALLAFVAIVLGGELFTTGTEWTAERFDLDESTTGSIFSALATTLPETLIPLAAILEGSGETIGVGAILGGPVTLTAFAPILLGGTALLAAAHGNRDRRLVVDADQTSLDLRVFLVGFPLAVAAGFVANRAVAIAVGVGLVGLYAWYLRRVLGSDGSGSVDTEPLEFGTITEAAHRFRAAGGHVRDDRTDPPTWLIVAQVLVAAVLLLGGADLFVRAVRWLAEAVLGTPEAVVALVLAPLVSNVPENVDGVIWVRNGRDVLAVEQLTGTLAFHGTVVVALGVLLTPWEFDLGGGVDVLLLTAVGTALFTGGVLFRRIRRCEGSLRPGVLVGLGLGYLLFLGVVLAASLGGIG